jgi:hypothetical protein
MKLRYKLVGLLAVVLLAATATGCNGNGDASDNCSLVLAAAVQYGQIPNVNWTLYESSYTEWPDHLPFKYACRGLTLDYPGGIFVRYGISDNDADYGGDDSYDILYGPIYETIYFPLPGSADWCEGHHVDLHPGADCGDH